MKKKADMSVFVNAMLILLACIMLITSVSCITYMNSTKKEIAQLEFAVEQLKASVPLEEVEKLEELVTGFNSLT